MHHSTSWWVSGLFSSRIVGSSATSRASAWRQLVLVGLGLGHDRHRQQRLGHRPRLHEQRVVLVRQRVAGLGRAQLRHGADVAGRALGHRALLLAQRRGQRADPLVVVVVLVPAVGAAVPGDVHRRVRAQRAGEHPHQADPADVGVGRGLDHLGEQRAVGVAGQAGDGLAVRRGDRRQRVLGGEGNASVMISSSSAMPIPAARRRPAPGRSCPRATAFSRSSISTSGSIFSPDRYRSMRDSSSLSVMMPSISSPRSSAMRSSSAAAGAPSARWPPSSRTASATAARSAR